MSQHHNTYPSTLIIDACRKAGIEAPNLVTDTATISHGYDKLGDYFAGIELDDSCWEVYYGNPHYMGDRLTRDVYTAFWKHLGNDTVVTALNLDLKY